MERATRSETCPSGDERNACGLLDEDTVDTKFDTSLETPRFEPGRRPREGTGPEGCDVSTSNDCIAHRSVTEHLWKLPPLNMQPRVAARRRKDMHRPSVACIPTWAELLKTR